MKTQKITINGQYASSNVTFEGTKKEVRAFLINEAREKRNASRELRKLENSVHAIDEKLHQSKLVTMASFKIPLLNNEQIIELLNAHGVLKYKLS
jgi:outer membrane protein assembly factor BamA